jgi:hypothetical protein
MTCLHHFVAHARLPMVYCENCGEHRSLEVKAPAAPRVVREPKARRPKEPSQMTMPFGMPHAIGQAGSMFDQPREPSAADMAELERSFFGAKPEDQADILEAMAKRVNGGRRVVTDADPDGTYRPGTSETIGRGAGISSPNE